MTAIPINHSDDDDEAFLTLTSSAIRGMLQTSSPDHYEVIKTDNWFDDKWITRRDEHIRFPNKRIAQVIIDGKVEFSEDQFPARDSRLYFSDSATIFYVSGHSNENGRGSLMGRFETDEGIWLWYVGFKLDLSWEAVRHKNISRGIFSEFVRVGS